jgi:hypothetical protein
MNVPSTRASNCTYTQSTLRKHLLATKSAILLHEDQSSLYYDPSVTSHLGTSELRPDPSKAFQAGFNL